jgi:hypothetical protein
MNLPTPASIEEALAWFDSLPTVTPSELRGRWRGRELRTGHPLEGWLEASGWYGKEFLDDDHVHPLLFGGEGGEPFPVRPLPGVLAFGRRLRPPRSPFLRALLRGLLPLLRTSAGQARLRPVQVRGRLTAAMVYDHLPVEDAFRRVDERTVLGLMQEKGVSHPYLFLLEREGDEAADTSRPPV